MYLFKCINYLEKYCFGRRLYGCEILNHNHVAKIGISPQVNFQKVKQMGAT